MSLEATAEEPPPDLGKPINPSPVYRPHIGIEGISLSSTGFALLREIHAKNGNLHPSYKTIIAAFISSSLGPANIIQTLDEMKGLGLIPREHSYGVDSPSLTDRGEALYTLVEALTT